ncbi:MAG: patatin-like phospholipase family protein [Thermodesulfobacteriota bacterium]|nr:patatin-like phospholipase family protein [Thermodesulfobacteriota bacterium]
MQKKDRGLAGSRQSSEELLLILAFSGGGTRAAALSYGVLEALDRVEMPYAGEEAKTLTTGSEKHTFLDEVDFISSVSGGSFTAAYYGLYGDRIFQDRQPGGQGADRNTWFNRQCRKGFRGDEHRANAPCGHDRCQCQHPQKV